MACRGRMVVASVYVLLVIGPDQFVLFQQNVQSDRQARLYRFLPSADCTRLVSKPAARAECAFFTAATGGVLAIALLGWAVISAAPHALTGRRTPRSPHRWAP